MKISFALITFVTTTNIMWGAVSKLRASVVGGVRPGSTVDIGRGAGGGASPGTRGGVAQGPGAIVGLSQGAGGGASSSATVALGQGAGGGASSGSTVGVGQGPGTTVGISRGAAGGAISGTTVGVSQGPSITVGLDRSAGGGASSGATVGVGQGIGTTVGVGQGAGGGANPGTTVSVGQGPGTRGGVGHGAGGGASLGTRGGVGQGAGGGSAQGTRGGVGQGARGGASPGTRGGVSQGAGGGAILGTKGDVGQGTGQGTRGGVGQGTGQGTRGCVGQDAGGIAGLGTRGGVGQGAGGGADPGTRGGVGQGAGGRARLGTKVVVGGTMSPVLPKQQKVSESEKAIKCKSTGFAHFEDPNVHGCVCNFAGACDKDNKLIQDITDLETLENYAPKGVEGFKYDRWPLTDNLVPICEGDTVGILYDCNGRIPLYAATVIYGTNVEKKNTPKRKDKWYLSGDFAIEQSFVANDEDYAGSSCIVHCYKNCTVNATLKAWDGSPCTNPNKLPSLTSIDKGHMIAARYGFGNGLANGVEATFTYTNAVPQIGSFNRGSWCQAEKRVIDLAKKCHQTALTNKQNARVYVVVGVIPTSFFGEPRFFGKPRFFGSDGTGVRFSNFQNDEYRLLLPEIMWTAVCCTHTDGTIPIITKAFYGNNSETNHEVHDYGSAGDMFKAMQEKWPELDFSKIKIFPAVPGCN